VNTKRDKIIRREVKRGQRFTKQILSRAATKQIKLVLAARAMPVRALNWPADEPGLPQLPNRTPSLVNF
jgi:hypothetical protein